MLLTTPLQLSASGHALDTSEQAFGELHDCTPMLGDAEALHDHMRETGYLFLRGFFEREDVMAARKVVTDRLFEEGYFHPDHDPIEGVILPGKTNCFRPDVAKNNKPLMALLYSGRIMEFYRDYFGEEVLHFDFTWFRAMGPGNGTKPHCDVVYMGRGTKKLCTAWVPIGDAPLHVGGLMLLEGSNRKHEKISHYLERDVDTYCTNNRHAADIESGKKLWEWDGSLTNNPASLREKIGGRWLTTDFRAGDFLTFSMSTIHASTDNQSNRIRLSSDSRYQPASEPADERWIGEHPIGHGLAGKRGRIC